MGALRRARLSVLLTALVLAAAGAGCGGGEDGDGGGGPVDGKSSFTASCGGCHALEAAGTDGEAGPNLDELAPDEAQVLNAVRTGPGSMPADIVEGGAAEAVARYVAQNAGR